MATQTAAILSFPPKGGRGFTVPAGTKLASINLDNLHSLTWARDAAEAQRDNEEHPEPEMTPDHLLSLLILNVLDDRQRMLIRSNIESLAASGAHAAKCLRGVARGLPTLDAWVEGRDGKRAPLKGEAM